MSGKSRSRKRSQAVNGMYIFFSKLFYFLLRLVCASSVAFSYACNVFYRKPFFYVFRRICRPKPDFICIRICFSLLYYCTFNNKPSFRCKFTSFLRSVPYQNVLFYFKVYMTQKKFFLVFRSLMRVQTDFKNKTCLKFLKASFFRGKIPRFSFKKMSPDWDLIYRLMTSALLDIVPGSVVFWLQNASKCSHSAALFAYI